MPVELETESVLRTATLMRIGAEEMGNSQDSALRAVQSVYGGFIGQSSIAARTKTERWAQRTERFVADAVDLSHVLTAAVREFEATAQRGAARIDDAAQAVSGSSRDGN